MILNVSNKMVELEESALFDLDIVSDIQGIITEATIGMEVAYRSLEFADMVLEAATAALPSPAGSEPGKKGIRAAVSGFMANAVKVFEDLKTAIINFIEKAKKAIIEFFDINAKWVKANEGAIRAAANARHATKIAMPQFRYEKGAKEVAKVCGAASTAASTAKAGANIKANFLSTCGASDISGVINNVKKTFKAEGNIEVQMSQYIAMMMAFVTNRNVKISELEASKKTLTAACDKAKSTVKSFQNSDNKKESTVAIQEIKAACSCALSCVGVQVSIIKEMASKYTAMMKSLVGGHKKGQNDGAETKTEDKGPKSLGGTTDEEAAKKAHNENKNTARKPASGLSEEEKKNAKNMREAEKKSPFKKKEKAKKAGATDDKGNKVEVEVLDKDGKPVKESVIAAFQTEEFMALKERVIESGMTREVVAEALSSQYNENDLHIVLEMMFMEEEETVEVSAIEAALFGTENGIDNLIESITGSIAASGEELTESSISDLLDAVSEACSDKRDNPNGPGKDHDEMNYDTEGDIEKIKNKSLFDKEGTGKECGDPSEKDDPNSDECVGESVSFIDQMSEFMI